MKRERGFTLIETLIAVVLFAIISASSYSVFSMGIQIWKRSQGRLEVERNVALAFERMGKDVRSALLMDMTKADQFSISKSKIEYKGNERKFQIPAMVQISGKRGELLTQVGRITYKFDPGEKAICKTIEGATDFMNRKTKPCLTLASEIRSAKFDYWIYDGIGQDYRWYHSWDAKDGLPQAVRIRLELNTKLKGERTGVRKKFERTFLIPVGGVPPTPTTVTAGGAT